MKDARLVTKNLEDSLTERTRAGGLGERHV